jgi:hypothetical protein
MRLKRGQTWKWGIEREREREREGECEVGKMRMEGGYIKV